MSSRVDNRSGLTAVELTDEGSPYIGAAFEQATAIVVLMTSDEVA